MEDLPIDGLPEFRKETTKLILGKASKAIAEGRVACCQSLSGTGALRLAAEFIAVNLGKSLNRCHRLKCAVCGEGDAPLGCKRVACRKNWHVPCAMEPTTGLVIWEDEHCVACPVCAEVLERRARGLVGTPRGRAGGVDLVVHLVVHLAV